MGPVPSVAILFGSMQGKTVKPGQVDVPGVVRYAHSGCQTQLGSVLQCVLSHYASSAPGTETTASVLRQHLLTWLSSPSKRGIKLEDLAKFIVVAPSMQGNQPISGETLNVTFGRYLNLLVSQCISAAALDHSCR